MACLPSDPMMAGERKDSGVSLSNFFTRCKLPLSAQYVCDAFVASRYSEPARPAPFQGYCSYTVLVGEDTIVQFRPSEHSLDIGIVSSVCDVYGSLAPETSFLGNIENTNLCAYAMRRMPGISLQDLRNSSGRGQTKLQRERVVRDFASLQAKSWGHAKTKTLLQDKRKVGSSLRWRLELMQKGVPPPFRRFAAQILRDLSQIEDLPWVLSHGDFLPANVMVSPSTGEILGLIDWAEAEYLPFGVGIYGLEELLGEMSDGKFEYYPEARSLRELFWAELTSLIPALSASGRMMRNVKAAQILGILLWHGIAFDDGKLNRAVQHGVDDEEIQRLDAFLLGSSGPPVYRKSPSPFAYLLEILFGSK